MKQSAKRLTLAASAFAFAVLFSFSWSEQSGVALSIESAQARVGRPLTPVSVAGVARRQNRRAAVGTAAAVGVGYGAGYYAGDPYYTNRVLGARAAYQAGAVYLTHNCSCIAPQAMGGSSCDCSTALHTMHE